MFVTSLKVLEGLCGIQAARFSLRKIRPNPPFKIKLPHALHKWEKTWLLGLLMKVIRATEKSNWIHPNLI